MDKINVQKIYLDLKKYKGEDKAKEFIFNLGNELQFFQSRLKNIMQILVSKYYNRISADTLIKLREINELCNVFENVRQQKKESLINKDNNSVNDFTKELTNKLNQIQQRKLKELDEIRRKHFSIDTSKNVNQNINNNINTTSNNNDIDMDDALWIPKELLDFSSSINEKVQELNVSFLDGIKSSENKSHSNNNYNRESIVNSINNDKNQNEDVLEIVNKDDEDVFLLNGKEISDEEFMNALKSKI